MFIHSLAEAPVRAASLVATSDGGGDGTGTFMILILGIGVLVVFALLRALSPKMAIIRDPIGFFFRAMMLGLTVAAIAFITLFLLVTSSSSFPS